MGLRIRFLASLYPAVVAAALGTAACGTQTDASNAAQPITLFTGPRSGAYFSLGEALADIYNAKISGARITAQGSNGPEGASINAEAVESGKADMAFSRSDLAYLAFRNGAGEAAAQGHLRAMAVLYTNAVHVMVRRASGIEHWGDIRGKRVQMGDDSGANSGTLTRMILEGEGLSPDEVQIVPNPRNAVSRLRSGELDVRIFASAYPLSGIGDVGPSSGLQFLRIDAEATDRLRARFPFFKPTIIPKGTYTGQDADYETVGIDGLLLCRDTLPESLVYEMTKTLFDALPDLMREQPAARLINVGRAPATPVPLHAGAARYYRERDLFR